VLQRALVFQTDFVGQLADIGHASGPALHRVWEVFWHTSLVGGER
jgi:hypothetical protein